MQQRRYQLLPSEQQRKKLVVVVPLRNEEVLLSHWIRHHTSIADHVVFLDYQSTDDSRRIIHNESPSTWQYVKSLSSFENSTVVGREVAHWESTTFPRDWHLALTPSEFLLSNDLSTASFYS
jgi:hypothetical protein